MVFFLVRIELSRIPEIPDRMEYSERTLRIFVDFGYYESQVHTSFQWLIRAGRFRPAPIQRFLFAERNSCGGCRRSGQTACSIS
jgi:hypothetical protein